jgi:chromosome condensin MukBEF complex kleisin-like MukF subunit
MSQIRNIATELLAWGENDEFVINWAINQLGFIKA